MLTDHEFSSPHWLKRRGQWLKYFYKAFAGLNKHVVLKTLAKEMETMAKVLFILPKVVLTNV